MQVVGEIENGNVDALPFFFVYQTEKCGVAGSNLWLTVVFFQRIGNNAVIFQSWKLRSNELLCLSFCLLFAGNGHDT